MGCTETTKDHGRHPGFMFFRQGLTWLTALSLLLCSPGFVLGGAEKTITATFRNQPLALVLEKLSEISGYTFVYDEEWADLNVSATINGLPLDKALRRILSNFNFAIHYRENKKVRILIVGDGDAAATVAREDRSVSGSAYVGSAPVVEDEPLRDEIDANETNAPPDDDIAEKQDSAAGGERDGDGDGTRESDENRDADLAKKAGENREADDQGAETRESGD